MRNKKRMLAAGLISMAFLSTVTGCGSASRKVQEPQGIQGTGGTAPNSSTADNTAQAGVSQHATAGSATMVNGGITEQEAKSIATGNAGVTEDGIQYITVKQDWDDGKARYEVEFTAAGVEYDYELDASDGRILSADSEVIDKGYSASQYGTADSQNAAGTSQTTQGGVSIETAKQTVMDKIPGIDAGNIYIHPDYDDGISLYEGEAYYAEVKYEFEILKSVFLFGSKCHFNDFLSCECFFMTKAIPCTVRIRLRIIWKICFVSVAYKEEIAKHTNLISLLTVT